MANQNTNPVTDDEREQVRVLHAQGLGRNAIAKQLGRSGRTISDIAKALGLTFDRAAATATATAVRTADLAALRAQLALDLTHDAMRLREQLWQPTKIWNFGGKENDYNERDVLEPPADAKRALMGTAGMAIDRSLKLAPPVEEGGADEARSMLGALADGIRRIAGTAVEGGTEEG